MRQLNRFQLYRVYHLENRWGKRHAFHLVTLTNGERVLKTKVGEYSMHLNIDSALEFWHHYAPCEKRRSKCYNH